MLFFLNAHGQEIPLPEKMPQDHPRVLTTPEGKKETWKSQKKSVATVNSRGKVTAIKRGTTKIRASIDGVTKECTITVL